MTRRNVLRPHLAALLAVSSIAGLAAAAPTTVRFDLPEVGLGIFGLAYSADYATPVEEVVNTRIVEARLHLEFNTEHNFGNLNDAANIALDFQAPIEEIARIYQVSGADVNWSGTGVFTADVTTDFLNDELLDFSSEPPGTLILWFLRLYTADATPLGGQFTSSYIEVDLEVIPEPATALLLLAGVALVRRR